MSALAMFVKVWFVTCVLQLFIISTAYASVIPAAIIRRHTITYKDVPVDSYKPIQHPVVYVPSSMVNLFVHFRSKSSQVHLKHVHKGNVGQTQHSVSQDEPHYLKHEIQKPVIQTIREVIVPYRQVIQEIKPVVEEVKTVVASRQPKSTVYMNFGPQYSDHSNNAYDNFRYNVMNTNHESTPFYNSEDLAHHTSDQSSSVSSNDSPNSLYDLSSIYGIKPTVDELASYLMPSQNNAHQNENQNSEVLSSPLIYGLTNDIQTESVTPTGYGYRINTIHENAAQNDVQNSGYNELNSNYQKDNTLEQNKSPLYGSDYSDKSYEQNYNLLQNIEPEYYVTEVVPKNNDNSNNNYYTDINTGYGTRLQFNSNSGGYGAPNMANSGYSGENSGDLATSDGSALGRPILPIFSTYPNIPIDKSTTLASLAQLMSALPYQYRYENDMNLKRNS